MEIRVFSISYFVYLAIFIVALVVLTKFLKTKSPEFNKRFISGLLFFALFIHFSKLLFPPYVNSELALKKITPENICALSTLAFPFIFLSKNKYLKDYMFYMGLISGTLAIVFPAEAFGKSPFIYDTIRFYIAHMTITIAPFLMVSTGLHKLDYHRVYCVGVIFLGVMAVILINEIILIEIGLVDISETPEGKLLTDPFRYRNFSFIFGPVLGYFYDNNITLLQDFFDVLIPNFAMTIPYGEFSGEKKYWPIIWAIVPVMILVTFVSFLISIYWEKEHMKKDWVIVKKYFKRTFNPKKYFLEEEQEKQQSEELII